jgi:hypothetical protein
VKRATFLAGLAVGLVIGMRLGRERYEQLKGLAQKVSNDPTVRNTTRTVTQKASELTKAASQQAADKLTESAKTGADKIKHQLNRNNHQENLETAAYP